MQCYCRWPGSAWAGAVPEFRQHHDSPPNSSATLLISTMVEAPALQDLLDVESLKSLSATCTVLRKWFNQQVWVITVQHSKLVATIFKPKWPNLVEIRHPTLYLHKLIQQVPEFTQRLSGKQLLALRSSCSMLRNCKRCKVIIMPGTEHMQWLRGQNHPSLQLIAIKGHQRVGQSLSSISRKKCTLLVSLEIEGTGNPVVATSNCIIMLLPPGKDLQSLRNEDLVLALKLLLRETRMAVSQELGTTCCSCCMEDRTECSQDAGCCLVVCLLADDKLAVPGSSESGEGCQSPCLTEAKMHRRTGHIGLKCLKKLDC